MYASVALSIAGLVASSAAAPLAARWANGDAYVFNGTYPNSTVFGPFSAAKPFDPLNNYFRSCSMQNYTTQYVVSIKSNNTYSHTESCGRTVNVTNTKTGVSAIGMIVDECLTCAYDYMLVSEALFNKLAPGAANFSATYMISDATVPVMAAPASATYQAPATYIAPPTTQQQQQDTQQQYTQQQQTTKKEEQQYTQQQYTQQQYTQQQYTQQQYTQQQQTTKKEEQQYTPTSTYYPPQTTTKYQAPTTTQQSNNNNNNGGSSNNGGGYSYSGQATWYTQDGNPGSCGNYNSDSAYIGAMNQGQASGTCGKKVQIQNTKSGKTITITIQDTCPGCGYGSIDLSTGAFSALGSLNDGVFPISWKFV